MLGFSPEPLSALANRISGTIELLAEQHRDGDIVIVSHQDPVQSARLSFAGRSLEGLHTDKPGHCSIITLRPSAGWEDLGMWTPE
jgi:broad specificity phosphatase PhoE